MGWPAGRYNLFGIIINNNVSGVLVQLARRALMVKKMGHAGTLDLFVAGLLVI